MGYEIIWKVFPVMIFHKICTELLNRSTRVIVCDLFSKYSCHPCRILAVFWKPGRTSSWPYVEYKIVWHEQEYFDNLNIINNNGIIDR